MNLKDSHFYYKSAWSGHSRIWLMCVSVSDWLILFQFSKIYSKNFIHERSFRFLYFPRMPRSQFVKHLSLFITNWFDIASLTPHFPVLLFIVLRLYRSFTWVLRLFGSCSFIYQYLDSSSPIPILKFANKVLKRFKTVSKVFWFGIIPYVRKLFRKINISYSIIRTCVYLT